MPRSIDHLADCHRAAETLRSQDKMIWSHTIDVSDVFRNNNITFGEKRDRIARILRRSDWFEHEGEWSDLHEVVDNISDAEDREVFDSWWDELYDLADYARVWIRTR